MKYPLSQSFGELCDFFNRILWQEYKYNNCGVGQLFLTGLKYAEKENNTQVFKYFHQGKSEAQGASMTTSHSLLYPVAAGLLLAKKVHGV